MSIPSDCWCNVADFMEIPFTLLMVNRNELLARYLRSSKYIDWFTISKIPKLPELFIKNYAEKVDWYNISRYQTLSEQFIRDFAHKVNWFKISEYQQLSEQFIREFANNIQPRQLIKAIILLFHA